MAIQKRSKQPVELSAEQEALAQRVYQKLRATIDDELLAMARLMVGQPDEELLGRGEFELRDKLNDPELRQLAQRITALTDGAARSKLADAHLAVALTPRVGRVLEEDALEPDPPGRARRERPDGSSPVPRPAQRAVQALPAAGEPEFEVVATCATAVAYDC